MEVAQESEVLDSSSDFTSTYLWVKVLLSLGFHFFIFKIVLITYDLPYSFACLDVKCVTFHLKKDKFPGPSHMNFKALGLKL